jgi:hypothetical protein
VSAKCALSEPEGALRGVLSALADPLFADTFRRCWQFGQAREPGNAERFTALAERLG